MVSHICLLAELGPICNSMAASLCSKKFVSKGKIMRYQRAKYVKHQDLGRFRIRNYHS